MPDIIAKITRFENHWFICHVQKSLSITRKNLVQFSKSILTWNQIIVECAKLFHYDLGYG